MRKALFFTTGVLAFCLSLSVANAATGTVSARALNVRSSASSRGAKVGSLRKGAKVKILGSKGNWLKIKHKGKTAYVYKKYVNTDSRVATSGLGEAITGRGWSRSTGSANSNLNSRDSNSGSSASRRRTSNSNSSTPTTRRNPVAGLDLGGRRSSTPFWLSYAKGEIGVKEKSGSANNRRIIEYHRATDLRAQQDSVAWCSSFVNWVMDKSSLPKTNKANARSWLSYGTKIRKPVPGAIVIFSRGNSSWQGHVGFIVSASGGSLKVLGGNQSDAVNIKTYGKGRLLGYRWPPGIPVPAAAR